MSYIINGTEVKVGQIWESKSAHRFAVDMVLLSSYNYPIVLCELDQGIRVGDGIVTRTAEGYCFLNEPENERNMFKMVQDISPQEPVDLTKTVSTQDDLECKFYTVNSPEGFSGSCTRNGKVEYEVWDQYGVAKINPMNTLKYHIRKDEGFVLCNVRYLVCSDTHVTDFVDEYDTEKQARDMQEPDQQLLRFFYEDGKIVKVDVLT
jgi:hypothetical protein